jgi:hypothetical protein
MLDVVSLVAIAVVLVVLVLRRRRRRCGPELAEPTTRKLEYFDAERARRAQRLP